MLLKIAKPNRETIENTFYVSLLNISVLIMVLGISWMLNNYFVFKVIE